MIADTIRYALKEHGKFVIYDAEHSFDGFNDDPDYAQATWEAAEEGRRQFTSCCATRRTARLTETKSRAQY